MYNTTAELSKTFMPIAIYLTSIISNTINSICDFYIVRKVSKETAEIAKLLKIEFPHESEEYIEFLVKNGLVGK